MITDPLIVKTVVVVNVSGVQSVLVAGIVTVVWNASTELHEVSGTSTTT